MASSRDLRDFGSHSLAPRRLSGSSLGIGTGLVRAGSGSRSSLGRSTSGRRTPRGGEIKEGEVAAPMGIPVTDGSKLPSAVPYLAPAPSITPLLLRSDSKAPPVKHKGWMESTALDPASLERERIDKPRDKGTDFKRLTSSEYRHHVVTEVERANKRTMMFRYKFRWQRQADEARAASGAAAPDGQLDEIKGYFAIWRDAGQALSGALGFPTALCVAALARNVGDSEKAADWLLGGAGGRFAGTPEFDLYLAADEAGFGQVADAPPDNAKSVRVVASLSDGAAGRAVTDYARIGTGVAGTKLVGIPKPFTGANLVALPDYGKELGKGEPGDHRVYLKAYSTASEGRATHNVVCFDHRMAEMGLLPTWFPESDYTMFADDVFVVSDTSISHYVAYRSKEARPGRAAWVFGHNATGVPRSESTSFSQYFVLFYEAPPAWALAEMGRDLLAGI